MPRQHTPAGAIRVGHREVASPREDDKGDVFDARVALYGALGAEGIVDLALHICSAILHEDGRVGVAL